MFGKLLRPKNPAAQAHDQWTALRYELDALTATPTDPAVLTAVAERWTSLALLPSTEARAGERLPAGFTLRPDDGVQDCLVAARAIDAVTWLIAAGVNPSQMLAARAELRYGWRQFDQAIDDLARAERTVPADHPDPARLRRPFREQARHCRAAREREPEPTPEQLASLRPTVAEAARRVADDLDTTPPRIELHPRGTFDATVDPRLHELDRELSATGFEHRTWAERPLEQRPQRSGFWVAADERCGVTGGLGTDGTSHVTVQSLLSDGRIVETNRSRGRASRSPGPWVDLLQIDPTESLADLIALHRSRVAALVATSGGVWVVPFDGLDTYLRMLRVEHTYVLEHRLEHGVDEAEARGYGLAFPAATVPMLQRAAWDAVQAEYTPTLPKAA